LGDHAAHNVWQHVRSDCPHRRLERHSAFGYRQHANAGEKVVAFASREVHEQAFEKPGAGLCPRKAVLFERRWPVVAKIDRYDDPIASRLGAALGDHGWLSFARARATLNAVSLATDGECGLPVTSRLSASSATHSPALLLRKLGNYSRRNRLYQAFAELGRKYAARVAHIDSSWTSARAAADVQRSAAVQRLVISKACLEDALRGRRSTHG